MDGSGYPNGLSQYTIPFMARICKIVDVYDALTSTRSYKTRLTPFDSLQLMIDKMLNQIDVNLLREFIFFLYNMCKIQTPHLNLKEIPI